MTQPVQYDYWLSDGVIVRLYDYTAAQSAYKICSMPMRYGVSPICS